MNNNSRSVGVDVNTLRLPFAVADLRHPPGGDILTVSGTDDDEGERSVWTLELVRPAGGRWPGPLSRAVHLALMEFYWAAPANPVTWTWRDLCRRMGRACSGRTVEELKEAIRAAAGLTVRSHGALRDARAKARIAGGTTPGLYERVEFCGGGEGGPNAVWLSDWHASNLAGWYSAPLDPGLWRRLHDKTPLASRLYEMLLYGRQQEVRKYKYTTLAERLPVRRQSHYSRAVQQLSPALSVLEGYGVLAGHTFDRRTDCVALVTLRLGTVRGGGGTQVAVEPVATDTAGGTPEARLVGEWYRTVRGAEHTGPANRSDLAVVRAVVEEHEEARAGRIVRLFAGIVRRKWPDVRSLKAAAGKGYLDEALAAVKAEEQQDRRREEAERACRGREVDRRRNDLRRLWGQRFSQMPPDAQEGVRARVRKRYRQPLLIPAGIIDTICAGEIREATRRSVEEYLAQSGRGGIVREMHPDDVRNTALR